MSTNPHATHPEMTAAADLGRAAYYAQTSYAPAMNGPLLDLIGDVPVGQARTIEIMGAFTAAYDREIDRAIAARIAAGL